MAVSFKVPASPKKSIFSIDNFLGVDLTNTGANIEEVRSPNAENMVRYVPGKVRKRTGYEKEIVFGTDTNLNYAIGTSSKAQEIKTSDFSVTLYSLIKKIKSEDGNPFDIYLEFDYTSNIEFNIGNGLVSSLVSPAEEWTHESIILHFTGVDDYINNVFIFGNGEKDIYIKNFSLMRKKDASYEWSKAPLYFEERTSNDPIYGCHVLKTGLFDGNRVKNVNRALNTSSSFTTYTVSGGSTTITDLAEIVYPGRRVYIECDYRLTGDNVRFYCGSYLSSNELTATSTTKHFSGSCLTDTYADHRFMLYTTGTATVEISNLSVMYEVDSNTYDWSPAPEDVGDEFPIGDTYYVGSKNYSTIETYENTGNATEGFWYCSATVCNATSKVEGFCHISFDLHTSSQNPISSIYVDIINSDNQYCKRLTYTSHINSKRFDFYISASSASRYISKIGVQYNVSSGTCWTYITNIQVNTITPRTNYDISSKWYLYHVGKDIYLRANNSSGFTKIYDDANQHLSKAWQFDKKLYILDGKNIYSYAAGDETVNPIGEENGYIPILSIAKDPSGGGISYEPLNMLQPGFYELFQGKADVVKYQLSFGNLDATTCKAWVLNNNGGWTEKIENIDFTVNRGAGYITFNTAPGVSPLTGEDNVKILAYRTVAGYKERITNCTIGALFGVGGAEDRLFLSGNPEYPNWDFYSEQYNPSYFPDTGYSALGSEASAIVGYAIVNNYLAAFKDGFDTSQSVFIREGDLEVNKDTSMVEPRFKLINTLQGNGVVAPYSFGYLQTEPLFLTKSGIFAITPQDITGEKYSQNRSFYLNGKLINEQGLENAVATVYNDMYVLALNNQLYILDGLQATRTDRSEPYATRQYVGFHCTDVPAICIWTDDETLYFGTVDGRVCRFHKDIEALESYSDDGKAIYACWETPDLDGKLFYKNKTFRYFAIRMMKALRTSVKLYSQKLGAWSFIKEDDTSGVVFDFENIDFEKFSFSTDTSEKVVHTKVRVKKVDKARFRVENGKVDEPFGLFDLALEYIESGNYKG